MIDSQYLRIIGKTLLKHTIEEHIGSGGFSHAYKVRNNISEDENPVKLFKILDESEFGKVWQRSVHEGRVLEDLADIEGVPDFYFSKTFNQYAIHSHLLALEYIPGRSLQDLIDSGDSRKMSEKELVKILYELATTIDQIHQKGVIHRDIKPSNVIVSPIKEGRKLFYDVHLIDFFSANYLDSSKNPPVIYKDKFFGTIGYVAPESSLKLEDQIKFDKLEDEKTDIFAFGVTAYSLINHVREVDVKTQTTILRNHHQATKGKHLEVKSSPYLSVFDKILIDTTMEQQDDRPSMPDIFPELERLIEKKWLYWRYKKLKSSLKKKFRRRQK